MNYNKRIKDLKNLNEQLKNQYSNEQNRNYCLQCKIDKLEKENEQLKENWNCLKEWLDNLIKETDKPVSKLLFKSVLSNIKKIEKSDK